MTGAHTGCDPGSAGYNVAVAGTRTQGTIDDEPDPTAPGSPAWWAARQDRAEPVRRVPITLGRIVAGALELIDREGLAALSMRNLATELQTGTTTLYRYVAGKDEVLVLVADAVLGETQSPGPVEGMGWREVLTGLARSMRTALGSHPNVAALLATAVPVGPHSLRGRDLTLGVLLECGFDATLAADVYTALAHQVLASVLQESMNDFRAGGLGTSRSLTLRDFYRSLPAGQYPRLVELADELTTRSAEEEFEFGLGCLLDGVELRLTRTRRHRSRNTNSAS
jgi:AcrR family transcriptional regulator